MPPPFKPVTAQADFSITPSPPHKALASRMPLSGTGTLETHTTEKASIVDPDLIKANHIEFPVTTVIVPIVIGLVVIILVILGSSLAWIRMKRSEGASHQTGRSSSIDEEKETKIEAVKTISNITTTSVDDDENTSISLQHWTSKKAVSNRYESWRIGEIYQEWVSYNIYCHELKLLLYTSVTFRGTKIKRKMVGNFHVIGCTSSVSWAKAASDKSGNVKLLILLVRVRHFYHLFEKTTGRNSFKKTLNQSIILGFCPPTVLLSSKHVRPSY